MLKNYNKLHSERSIFMALFFAKKESFSVASEQFARYEKLLKENEIDYSAEENESEIIITYPEKQHEKVEKIRNEIDQEDYENEEMSMEIDARIFKTYGLKILMLLQKGLIAVRLNADRTSGRVCCRRKNEHFLDELMVEKTEKDREKRQTGLDRSIAIAGKSIKKNKIPTVKIKVERYLKNEIERLLQINYAYFYEWSLTENGYEIEIREADQERFYAQYMIALAAFSLEHSLLQKVLQPDKSMAINPEKAVHPEELEQKKKKKLTRSKSMLIRLTPTEYDLVQTKIDKSGHKQSDYLRAQVMYGNVNEVPASMESIETLNELKNLAKEFGRVEGMIAKTIRVHEKSYFLSAEEMLDLKNEVKELRKIKKEIKKKVNEWYS